MKKLILFILAGILLFSLVGLINADAGKITAYVVDSGQGNGNNQLVGNDSDEHGCIGSAGYTWCESLGECIRLWETNCSEAHGKNKNLIIKNGLHMNLTMDENNKTIAIIKMSNGKNAIVKIMPETASQNALEVLGAKCEIRNCTIQLKEVGNGNQTKAEYQVEAEKEVKLFGFIKMQMRVQAQVDSETGNVTSTKKPWWAFLAKEE